MAMEAHTSQGTGRPAHVFEHSITWEDDIWRLDPHDVADVHASARAKFDELLEAVREGKGSSISRMLLFHGQSGAGKTHLLRALRTQAHGDGRGYFGYAQMTPDVLNYADYFLRRLISSLEKPYDPVDPGASSLMRLSNRLVQDAGLIDHKALEDLRECEFEPDALAQLVIEIADEIVASEKIAELDLDINIVRALLYMQRSDPRIDQRVRQYLYGRPLNEISRAAVGALDPNDGEGRAFEIIESLGRIMHAVDGAALVFAIDQVEDLRFFDDAEERFQKAVRDLIQIANRVPSSIVIISCLDDFYFETREFLPQSFTDRIEKSGPVRLEEARSTSEARLIIASRLEASGLSSDSSGGSGSEDVFDDAFFDEVAGLTTRRLLETAERHWKGLSHVDVVDEDQSEPQEGISQGGHGGSAQTKRVGISELWDQHLHDFEPAIPEEEEDLMSVFTRALGLLSVENGGEFDVVFNNVDWLVELVAADLTVTYRSGESIETRLFVCNKGSQGGALKRQVEKVLQSREGKPPIILRTVDFPPSVRSATGQSIRRFLSEGGRRLVVPLYELERILSLLEFHKRHGSTGDFTGWLREFMPLGSLPSILQLMHLVAGSAGAQFIGEQPDRDTASVTSISDKRDVSEDGETPLKLARSQIVGGPAIKTSDDENFGEKKDTAERSRWGIPFVSGLIGRRKSGDTDDRDARNDKDEELPEDLGPEPDDAAGEKDAHADGLAHLSFETSGKTANGTGAAAGDSGLFVGTALSGLKQSLHLTKNVLKRHMAVLGGSGSGKTTLALSVIEQLLMSGTPVVLIDRKGDLCSYANPDVWRAEDNEQGERVVLREDLGSSIDVAVYTPGRTSGRPISITLLPSGIGELPEHERQQLANVSAAALADMLHLKKSATHQRQGGILSVALNLLGAQSLSEVTLADLIYLLENEDMELVELTQRMDPSGRLRRDLVAQLDSLRHRNLALFEGGGEPLRMESLLGIGPHARPGRTRLSVIYTGFLGDNQNILFWVAQFLSEALRFCQRNPNDELQAVIMFDEADLYIPSASKPATKEPLESLMKRARSAGVGMVLATQSPGDLDYKSRDQVTSWFIGKVREDTALKKLKAAFASDSGIDPAMVLPNQTVGEFHLIQEGVVCPMKSQRSLIQADQVPFDRIEQLARETKGHDEKQLKLFDVR